MTETKIPRGEKKLVKKETKRNLFEETRFTSLDQGIIKILPPVLIIGLIILVLTSREQAFDAINSLRTFVTENFTWMFVSYSLLALAVCAWLAFSKFGKIKLGGAKAKPEHGKFAWYSMLFACGQGAGLILWSVAEPVLMRDESPLVVSGPNNPSEGGIVWTYFHWGLTAWAMYCIVAVCLAYSHHNLKKPLTFRHATVDILPEAARRPAGVVIELLAVIATVLGLATSFGFTAMQMGSGLHELWNLESGFLLWIVLIVILTVVAATSAFFGINKGMKRISEANTILSLSLLIGILVFGPTLFIISNTLQTFGTFFTAFPMMSFWTDSPTTMNPLSSWQDSWNGSWTVFIWCWVIAFSPFVAGFIARISRGRTIREFVLGVVLVPTVIVMLWVGIIASAVLYYDDKTNRSITSAVGEDTASGLFVMVQNIPLVGTILLVIATVMVATYYVTSLDSGAHALAEFVSAPKVPGPGFRVVLVASIATVTITLLGLGGVAVVDIVQTGTVIGAFPFTFVIVLMIMNTVRRLRNRTDRDPVDETNENLSQVTDSQSS